MEQVLYFATASLTAVRPSLNALDSAARSLSPLLSRGVRFHQETSLPRALERLKAGSFSALLIDARSNLGPQAQTFALELLHKLFDDNNVPALVARERTWLIVDADEKGADLSFQAGTFRIAGALVACLGEKGWRDIWQRITSGLQHQSQGRVALCLAGGGIEGLYYELGALRALQYFLPNFLLQDVDIVCGISSGALLGAFLSSGLGPQEIANGLQFGEGRIDRIHRTDVFDLNLGDLAERFGLSALGWAMGKRTALQALLDLTPSGLFAGAALGRYLERQLTRPGMVNRFTDTRPKLFIGATDQDTAEPVVFGSSGWDHVPIHLAVRASTALTPVFAPQVIEGRYYMDGGGTRTTNIRIALKHGATVVILVDPLVPTISPKPGTVASTGGLIAGAQAYKALVHGRFDRALFALRALYPQVSFHLFQPEGAVLRLMNGSPRRFFYRPDIEDIAFRETLRSIRQYRFERLRNDFDRLSVRFEDPEADLGRIKRDLFEEASEVQVA